MHPLLPADTDNHRLLLAVLVAGLPCTLLPTLFLYKDFGL
jgi:hypothetical protein